MRYRIFTQNGIEAARTALQDRDPVPDLSSHEATVGSGDQLDEAVLNGLAQRIRKIQGQVAKDKEPP